MHTASALQPTMWLNLSSSKKRRMFLLVFWALSVRQCLWKLPSVFFVVYLTLLFQFQGVELLRILRWEESLKKWLWAGLRLCNGVFLKRDLKKEYSQERRVLGQNSRWGTFRLEVRSVNLNTETDFVLWWHGHQQ